jgi:hypothetical protein
MRIRVEQDRKATASYFPHHNRESRAAKAAPIGVKATNEACRVFRIFQRLTKDAQGNVVKREYWRLKIPPPRNLVNYEKLHGKKWEPDAKDLPPPDAELLGDLKKGQLMRVPIGKDSTPASRGQPATHGWWWYRVASLKDSNGQVEFKLAEYKEPKTPPSDKPDKRTEREKLIRSIWKTAPSGADVFAYFIELNDPKRVAELGYQIIPADAKAPESKSARAKNAKQPVRLTDELRLDMD